MLSPKFCIGDRVVSRGLVTRGFGIGQITSITRNVATVHFSNGGTESFHVELLRPALSALSKVGVA